MVWPRRSGKTAAFSLPLLQKSLILS
ncbi:hypothetical protein ACLBR5_06490 [Escherichia coli]